MGKDDRQIDLEERCRICAMRSLGHSLNEICRTRGRSKSTICRYLTRSTAADGYKPDQTVKDALSALS